MRTFALLALLVAAILCLSDGRRTFLNTSPRVGFLSYGNRDTPNSALKPFQQKNTEYTFIYNAQMASGMQSEENAANPQQKAVTRIQCLAKIQFASERHGQLQLEQCQAGQQNEQMSDPQEVQPMWFFEQTPIPSQTKTQLQKPCQFTSVDGVIERVQCQQDETQWTKNFKKAVLNIIQLNLKRNNVQGLRGSDERQQNTAEQDAWQTKQGKSFSIQEITMEGACQTTYTINRAWSGQQYNVTKTINFNKCQKIADVANGFQTDPPQAQCAQCQQYWAQQQSEQFLQHGQSETDNAQNGEQNPCAKCDPKEVKEHELDRSTVIRCQIQGEPTEQYTLHGCEMRSQYLYRNSKSATGNYGAAMQTIVAATLQAMDSKHSNQQIPAMSASAEETLMYSNDQEVEEKRFYMNGDDDFGTDGKNSPFAHVPNVQQAEQALLKLVQNMQDKLTGIDQQAPLQQQRLVEMLRMSTQQELRQLEKQCPGTTAPQKEQCKQILVNALAECGTKNCVAELAKRIKNKQVSQANAVKALLALTQLPAPSDNIVEEMEKLCNSDEVKSEPTIKQSCWLTFGALVNEVCQHKTEPNAQQCAGQTANCAQSGFFNKGQCPMDKKQKYKEAMLNVFQSSDCIYDKIVALSAFGNAGMDNSLKDLENIIKDAGQPRVVRVMAIYATRRLHVNAPWAVQSVLVPVFLNTREQPHVRIAAFANLMNEAQPEPQVVDQLMYSIANEPNKEVQAYAYRTMKAMAQSQKPNEQQIAKHIRSALKMVNVDEQQLRGASGKWQFSLFNNEEREGVFVSLAQAVSARSALPAYAHAQLDSHFNDQYQLSNVKVFMLQQEVEKWYGNMANQFVKQQQQQQTRGQRRNQQNSEKLGDIYKALGIKSRRSFFGTDEQENNNAIGKYQQNVQPFAMIGLRSNNVDKAFIALDEHLMEEQTRRILNGQEKADWAFLFGQGQQLNMAIVQNLNEKEAKIPTSVGVPLRILNSMPILANIDGQMNIKAESARLSSPLGIQFDVNAKACARLSQIQKMELWTPFASSGVESVRSAQVNVPFQGELNANSEQGISLKAKLPQQKTQLANIHSLPITFTAKVDQNTKLVREPRQILTIHDPNLERQQHELNAVQGQKNLEMPLHFRGHYHWPAEATIYAQFAQLLMATENAMSVHYQPSRDSPREAIFRVTGEHFQRMAQSEQPDAQLRNFFDQQFASAYSCDDEQCEQRGDCEQCEQIEQQQQEDAQELEQDKQTRQQTLHSFISAYKPRQQYKHSLKLVAQTNGGAKDAKAQCDMQAVCDEQTAYCKVQVKMERPPIGNENQKWMLNAQAHVVMPETAASMEQLQAQPNQLKQFIAQANAQWGPQGQSKQQVNIRVHGTQAHTQQVRAVLQQQQQQAKPQLINTQQLRNLQRRSAFLNKFQIETIYSLKANAQNAINRVLELLKSAYFWNTQSQLLSGQSAQKNGKIAATILIDPVTQTNANITIRTPAQQLRMEQIGLPYKVRPFALIRQRSVQQTHSLAQLFHQFSIKYRPQCTVDGRKVNTFDDFIYSAPLSSDCFAVLAKDCGTEQPQFAVLMKKVPNQQQNKQAAQKAYKVLKVITPEQQIECHPKKNADIPRQLMCKVNGQQVTGDEQCHDSSSCVQFNTPQFDDVTIQTQAIAVRFNGRKAWLKVSQAYKNSQCGLCGHYDDSDAQGEELRMANGERASELVQFHRSFALEDSEQCSQQVLNNFYSEQNNEQGAYYQQYNQFDNDDETDNGQWEEESEKEQFNGQLESSEQNNDADNPFDIFGTNGQQQQQCCCCCGDDEDNENSQCQQNCQNSDKCQGKCDQKQCQQQTQTWPTAAEQQQPCCCCCQEDEQCERNCQKGGQCDAICQGKCADQQQQQAQWKGVWPILKTKTHEQNHAVCFSTRPVKQCPQGAYAYIPLNGNYGSGDEQQQQKTSKVSFVCMDRAEPETRRLLRSLRHGQRVVDVNARSASFMATVSEPQQCWRSRN